MFKKEGSISRNGRKTKECLQQAGATVVSLPGSGDRGASQGALSQVVGHQVSPGAEKACINHHFGFSEL